MELCKEFSARGIHILLASLGGELTDTQRKQAKKIKFLHLEESNFRLEWMRDPWQDTEKASGWLATLGQGFTPDIIHLNQYCFGCLSWNAPVVMVGHSCVASWWNAVKNSSLPEEWNRYKQTVKTGLQCADCVIAPTKAMLTSLRKHYGLYRRGTVIPNGRTTRYFKPGLKENFIFTAGRIWDEGKNIRVLAEVARSIPWPIFVAGEYREDLNEPNLILLGKLNEQQIRTWFARASIYVSPAFYEPFGLSVLEAGLSGCALVISDIPPFVENWAGAAFFVDPASASCIRDGLLAVINSP
ncbi:MAG: glycosyl transferase family 1, partial [Acidobacteria bacterium]